MPTIADPFVANVPRSMSKGELIQAIRVDLASELEATLLYEAHAAATDDEVARAVLRDIANEEKEHMGELLTLLQYLSPEEAHHYGEGVGEVEEMMSKLGVSSHAGGEVVGSVIRNEEGAPKA